MEAPAQTLAFYAFIITALLISQLRNLLFAVFVFALRFCATYALLVVSEPVILRYWHEMEPKAAELVAVLTNSNLSIDTKVTHILGLKSDIKQKNVPEGAVPPIFESLRLSIASPHYALLAAGFSTLGHCLKRLFIQGQHDLVSMHARVLYPHLIERLGDSKERIRAQAAQAFTELWPASNADVEECVLSVALKSKNPKSKQAAMVWLDTVSLLDSALDHGLTLELQMHNTHVILFRQYVPDIVACLENADSTVRDQAKTTILTLFE
jgi:CLIP-associating protein 1/2